MKIWLFLLIGLAINNANSSPNNEPWGGCERSEVNSPVICCQNFRDSPRKTMICGGLNCGQQLRHQLHIDCLNNVLIKRNNISEEEKSIINTEISRITNELNNLRNNRR